MLRKLSGGVQRPGLPYSLLPLCFSLQLGKCLRNRDQGLRDGGDTILSLKEPGKKQPRKSSGFCAKENGYKVPRGQLP